MTLLCLTPLLHYAGNDSSFVSLEKVRFTSYFNKFHNYNDDFMLYGIITETEINVAGLPLNFNLGLPLDRQSFNNLKPGDFISLSFDRNKMLIPPDHGKLETIEAENIQISDSLLSGQLSFHDSTIDFTMPDSLNTPDLAVKPKFNFFPPDFVNDLSKGIKIESFSLFKGVRNDDYLVFKGFVFNGISFSSGFTGNKYLMLTGGKNSTPAIQLSRNSANFTQSEFFRIRGGFGKPQENHIHLEYIEGRRTSTTADASFHDPVKIVSAHAAYNTKFSRYKIQLATEAGYPQQNATAYHAIYGYNRDNTVLDVAALISGSAFRSIDGAPWMPGSSMFNLNFVRTANFKRFSLTSDWQQVKPNGTYSHFENLNVKYALQDKQKRIQTEVSAGYSGNGLANEMNTRFHTEFIGVKKYLKLRKTAPSITLSPYLRTARKVTASRYNEFKVHEFSSGVESGINFKKISVAYNLTSCLDHSELSNNNRFIHLIASTYSLSKKCLLSTTLQLRSENRYLPDATWQSMFTYKVGKNMLWSVQYTHLTNSLITYSYDLQTNFKIQL